MKVEKPYIVWNAKLNTPPPPSAVELVGEDEQLYWAAVIPSALYWRTLRWSSAMWAVTAIAAVAVTPWGKSLQEYCGNDPSRSCVNLYYNFFVISFICFLSTAAFLMRWWQGKLTAYSITYAISDRAAYRAQNSNPAYKQAVALTQNQGVRGPSGTVSIGFGHSAIGLIGLDSNDSAEALYWANCSRFTSDAETKARETTHRDFQT